MWNAVELVIFVLQRVDSFQGSAEEYKGTRQGPQRAHTLVSPIQAETREKELSAALVPARNTTMRLPTCLCSIC